MLFRSNQGSAGQGSVYYETGQTHVTALAFDSQGRLLAGSEPNGILYRVSAPGRAFVLYKSSLPEIRAIASAGDGSIYAAAMGGGITKRVGAAASAITSATGAGVPVVSTTITVTEQSGINPPPKPDAPKPAVQTAVPIVVTTGPATNSTDSSGTDRSALYKISPDNSVETMWTSKEENIYDVVWGGPLEPIVNFLTDVQGRIYRPESALRATMVAQANEGDATRLLSSNRGLLVATGNLGKLLRLGGNATGWYESPVRDAGTVAKWGRISWHSFLPGVAMRTRSGNSARPDTTWSDWSAPLSEPAAITSHNARYIQWRADLVAVTAQGIPAIDDVIVAYLPQNSAPVVKSLVAAGASGTKPADTSPMGTIAHGGGQQIQLAWQADDPDGDKLIYNLYFRGEDES